MKDIVFLGNSLDQIRDFSSEAKQEAGYQLDKVQNGLQPSDFKHMPSIGRGVEEIRIRDGAGAWRVIYTAKLEDAVYVLHAFQKKTQATSKKDIELAKARYLTLMREVRR